MSVIGESCTPDRRRAALGYTLLELMVVLAIVCLMAGMIPLALGHALPGRRVVTTMQRLTAWVTDAQTESLASGLPLRLTLSGQTFSAQPPTGSAHLKPLTWATSTDISLVNVDGVRRSMFTVYPDGSTAGAELHIADGTHRARLRVSALTGRITAEVGP